MLEQKAAQLIQKLCQNVATLVFDYKVMILKIAKKLQNNWATFVSKFVKNIRNCPIWSRWLLRNLTLGSLMKILLKFIVLKVLFLLSMSLNICQV